MTEFLTHDRLNHKFQNNFDLTNFAIGMAKQSITEGEPKALTQILKDLENLPDIEEKKQD